MSSPYIRNGKFCSFSLRAEYLHTSFGILLHWRFVSSSHLPFYLVVYLYQYRLMDVRFIPWDINQYYSFTFMYIYVYVLYLAEIVPVLAIGNSFSWHRYPFYISYYCVGIFDLSVFVLHFLAFWNYKMLQALLIYFLPSAKIRHFYKEPWFFVLENVIRN